MQKNFREFHLLRALESHSSSDLPLDNCLRDYFRENRALGSKDRRWLTERVYTLVRFRGLFDHFSRGNTWEERLHTFQTASIPTLLSKKELPPHIKVSFPAELFDLICKSHGEEKGVDICKESNTQAPTTIRINPTKTTRDKLVKLFNDEDLSFVKTKKSPLGLISEKRFPLLQHPIYQKGLFEIQDEGSQLLCALVDAKPGHHVLDFCAGSGGKSLGFAHQMDGKGQIYLSDIREKVLLNAKKRLRRAGVQNVQIILPKEPSKLKKLHRKMDRVLLDVPCSGTGTIRRNPDMKWRFKKRDLDAVVAVQRELLEKGVKFLAPGGHIIYTTCSILREENWEQVEWATSHLGLEIVAPPLELLPAKGSHDGFFGVVLRRKVLVNPSVLIDSEDNKKDGNPKL